MAKFPCVSKQCPADGVWRIGRGGSPDGSSRHGLPPQRAPLDTVYPLRKHLHSVQRMVSGGYCEGLFPDTVCWTRLRNTWNFGRKKSHHVMDASCRSQMRFANLFREAAMIKTKLWREALPQSSGKGSKTLQTVGFGQPTPLIQWVHFHPIGCQGSGSIGKTLRQMSSRAVQTSDSKASDASQMKLKLNDFHHWRMMGVGFQSKGHLGFPKIQR